MAIEDLILMDEYYNANRDEISRLVSNFLDKLVEIRPEVCLRVEILSDGNVWRGYFYEPKNWGEKDIYYGYIDIIPNYLKTEKPSHIKVYCSNPKFELWIVNLIDLINRDIPKPDEDFISVEKLLLKVEDKDSHREIVKLYLEDYSIPRIKKELCLNITEKRIYNIISECRNQLKKEFHLPYHQEWRNKKLE